MRMKTLRLIVSDDVASELKQSITIKAMTGSAYGVADSALAKIAQALADNDKTLTLDFKDKPDPEIAAMQKREAECIEKGGHWADNQGLCHGCGARLYD
jgi:hypothetical protein